MSSCSGHLLLFWFAVLSFSLWESFLLCSQRLTYSTFSATGLALWLPHSNWFREGFVAVIGSMRVLSFSVTHSLLLPFRSLVLAYLHLGHHMERALQWMKSEVAKEGKDEEPLCPKAAFETLDSIPSQTSCNSVLPNCHSKNVTLSH